MKAKRFFANLIVLTIAAAAVFFIGWISFYIKPGCCAIMTTKTGGLYRQPIKYGEFLWRWERLLPTNVNLVSYELKEHSFVQSVSGTLPSADLYKTMLTPKPDFSYSFTVKATLSVTPEKIMDLVKAGTIENSPESLDEYMRTRAVLASNQIAIYLLKTGGNSISAPTVLPQSQIGQALSERLGEFDGVTIDSAELASCKIPDMQIYEKAKDAYETYISDLNEVIREKTEGQASSILQLENSMKQLEQFANLLEKYPKFNDFSKSENLTGVMEKLIQNSNATGN